MKRQKRPISSWAPAKSTQFSRSATHEMEQASHNMFLDTSTDEVGDFMEGFFQRGLEDYGPPSFDWWGEETSEDALNDFEMDIVSELVLASLDLHKERQSL